MIGQTISHYRIVSQLGVGGMGVVYAAHDPRLNRQVALKFVPEELAHDAHALERLRSEARTASGLNHPNICTIYDIGEHNGRPFIVMELLNGITLRDRLSARPLKIHETIDIGIHVADALFWAHNKDIIHRDIKPANLFLVDQGQLKILDFGLAKYVTPREGTEATVAPTIDLTAVGVAVGTGAYMSPEQVSGDVLDRRTDLFSLGVVLYECATGQQPFTGKTSAVVLASILTQAPTPPTALNAEVPPRLQEIINNCLEKDRELRYQDAAGLRADLKRIKRDLESGAQKTAAALSSGGVSASSRSVSVATITPPSDSSATAQPTAAAPQSRRDIMIGAATTVVVAVIGLAVFLMFGRGSPQPEPAAVSAPAPAPTVAAAAPTEPPPPDPANQSRARFDEAIVEANRLLATGDTDGATRALNVARAIDPGAPAVVDLSARLVERFKTDAEARRASSDSARTPSPRRPSPAAPSVPSGRPSDGSVANAAPAAPAPAAAPSPAEAPVPNVPVVTLPAAAAPPRPTPVAPPPAPAASQPAPARSEPAVERRTPAAPPPAAEDDDAAIRRVVTTYAHAIETKDLALFRSVKPNMSADEQRRIEEGFRAVTSQRVTVTILSIEQRGQEAAVRLRRRDVIQAAGRQQTADSQQTMTLAKTGTGWVIREIGR